MATSSVPKAERMRSSRSLALKEAIERFDNELMDDAERLVLLDRIRRLKRSLASAS